jgi:RNase P subunit RPR2
MSNRVPKSWVCPSCQTELGLVVYNELYINEAREINTDGTNLVVKCHNCGYRKVWYAADRLSEIIRSIADETARLIVSKSKQA